MIVIECDKVSNLIYLNISSLFNMKHIIHKFKSIANQQVLIIETTTVVLFQICRTSSMSSYLLVLWLRFVILKPKWYLIPK